MGTPHHPDLDGVPPLVWTDKNKKFLLCECKRHTTGHIAGARYAGYPIQSWWGVPHPVMVVGVPHSVMGVPWVPHHHPDLAWGVLQVPPTIQT